MGMTFNGVDIESTYGIVVDGADTWTKPTRDREPVHVPGLSGDLLYDNGSWHNVTLKYHCHIPSQFADRFESFCDWLYSLIGYYRFEDQFRHPGVYRMAEFAGPIDPETIFRDRVGNFDLVLNAKPQQWLESGEIDVGLTYTAWVRGHYTKGSAILPDVWSIDGFVTSNDGTAIATPYLDMGPDNELISAIRVTNDSASSVTVNLATAYYSSDMSMMSNTYVCNVSEVTLEPHESRVLGIPGEDEIVVVLGERYRRYSVQCDAGLGGITVECATVESPEDTPDWQHYEESSTLITNHTKYAARPIIEVEDPQGVSFAINDYTIDIGSTASDSIIIDCELEDCYSYDSQGEVVNENGYISISCSNDRELSDFPYLIPGENSFHVLMGVDSTRDAAAIASSIKVKPNWYRI